MDHTKTEHMLHHHRRGTMLRGIYPRRQAEGRSEVADCAMTARAALAVYSRSPQLAWRQAAERELDYALTHLCRRGGAFSAREDAAIYPGENALMIGALAVGGRVLGKERYLRAAVTARLFLKTRLTDPRGFLYRFWRDGEAVGQAQPDDYANYILALTELYEANGSRFCLREAMHLADQLEARFAGRGER